jgi:hypothetical protein
MRVATIVVLIFSVCGAVQSAWQRVGRGIEYRELGSLHLVRIDPAQAEVAAVIKPGASARRVAQSGRWTFAMNANFFDVNLQPLGVVMSGGRSLHAVHGVAWQSIFAIGTNGRARIVLPADFAARSVDVALQAGPRLVAGGAPVVGVARGNATKRSGVCIDGRGAVIFFATTDDAVLDVHALIDLAARSESKGGMGCRDAMLFDGGPSTQLFLARSNGAIDLPGDTRVPVFVTARPRPLSH